MPWWSILVLVLVALAGVVYWQRKWIAGLLSRKPKEPSVPWPAAPPRGEPHLPIPPVRGPIVRVVPPLEPPLPEPPVVETPIVREDDPPVTARERHEREREFGGPIPRGFGARFDGLMEITRRQIEKYVPYDSEKAIRYFVDPSLRQHSGKGGGSFALVAPEALIRSRATMEAKSIPVFSVSKGLSVKQIREKREEFIDTKLRPALTKPEDAWLLLTGSLTGPESVDRLARRRAEAAMPDWLRAVSDD